MGKIKINLLTGALFVVVAIGLVLIGYQMGRTKSTSQKTQSSAPATPTGTASSGKPHMALITKDTTYALVDLASGQRQSFLPAGYTVVDPQEYPLYPDYLILKKDSELFSYNIKTQAIMSIFGSDTTLRLKKSASTEEQVTLYPSISEKHQFVIEINEIKPSEGLGIGDTVSSRAYTYNATTNKLATTSKLSQNCREYDSRYQRFFIWPCGEGIGSSTPLTVTDMNDKAIKQVITQEEFGLTADNLGPIDVTQHNGLFIAVPKNKPDLSKIVSIDAREQSMPKQTYTFTEQAKNQIEDIYPYSATISVKNKTIVVGGGHDIILLPFNAKNEITSATYIKDKELYANNIFHDDDTIYYLAKEHGKALDLATGKVQNLFARSADELEFTIIKQ